MRIYSARVLISKGRAAAGTLLCLRWKVVSLLSFTSSEVGNGRGIPLARLWGQHSWPWVEGVSVRVWQENRVLEPV